MEEVKSETTRAMLIFAARTWLGTPYHHQGRVKGIGVDCIGLIIGLARDLKLPEFDRDEFRQYRRSPPRGENMLKYFDEAYGEKIEKVEPGDVMIFWMNEHLKTPKHIALRTDTGILHTHSGIGMVVEHGYSAEWQNKFICGYRIPGIK